MDAASAAARWADTWAQGWPKRDAEAIAALYSDAVVYRSPPFREPDLGLAGVRRCLGREFSAERNIQCWFGTPIVSGDRAAVEWWSSWTEEGRELTFAGVTVLRFDEQGKVVEHRDYDNHVERREPPYAEWSRAWDGPDVADGEKHLSWWAPFRRVTSRTLAKPGVLPLTTATMDRFGGLYGPHLQVAMFERNETPPAKEVGAVASRLRSWFAKNPQ